MEKLTKYKQKRDFDKTDEPIPLVKSPQNSHLSPFISQLKFVVQHHIASRDHYDFRLEWKGVLLSWAVPKGPSFNPADKRLAAHVEDHPLDYRYFEGTIPKGQYGGGTVMVWDEGYWEPVKDIDKGLKEGSLKFTLFGKRLNGKWALARMKATPPLSGAPRGGNKGDNWLLIKEKDGFAKEDAGISQFVTSVKTGRTMEEIERGKAKKKVKNPFSKVNVQLAKLVDSVPKGGKWLYEIKYDGYRIIAFLESGVTRLVSRNGNDYTKKFQDIADSLSAWANGRAMVLDGEAVVSDKSGRTDFNALQNYIKSPENKRLQYVIFDILALDGGDVREKPLIKRKEILENLMENAPANLHYSKHSEGGGEECFKAVCSQNLEGLIGKKAGSIYRGARNGDWIKLKCGEKREFIIGGYTVSEKKESGISSILLGNFGDENLIYEGRAGTGFSESDGKELKGKFDKIKINTCPFADIKIDKKENYVWVKPQFTAEIQFAERTKDGLLRHASFKGLK